MLHEVGLSHSGRPDHHDVLLLELQSLALLSHRLESLGVIVVIAHRNRQSLLRFVLTNDIAIEVRLDIAG